MKLTSALYKALIGRSVLLYYLCYFSFWQVFAFNSETDNNMSYSLYLSGIILLILANIYLLFQSSSNAGKDILLLTGASLLLLFQSLSNVYFGASNEYLTSIAVVFAIYCCLRMTCSTTDILFAICALLTGLLIQLFIAARQFSQSIPSEWDMAIKGTLENSGVFACYVVVHIPLLAYGLQRLQTKKVVKPGIAIVFLLLVAIVLYLTRSRTAIISCFVSLGAILCMEYQDLIRLGIKRYKPAVIGTVFLAIAGLSYGMYHMLQMKKLSVSGRSLMLKVAERHVYDHFWLGTGVGRFTWYYPQWQADYFRSAANSSVDLYLSAGKAYVIFNEYIQLLEEVGIVGFLIFLFLLYNFFRSRSVVHKRLLNYLKITVIAILACAFTSYPFHVNVILLILALCFATAFALRDKKPIPQWLAFSPRIGKVILAGALLCLLYTGTIAVRQHVAVSRWTALRTNDGLSRQEKRQEYAALYDDLKYDGKFLLEYGQFLSHNPKDCLRSIDILEESKRYFLSYLSYSASAAAYTCAGKYPQAIGNYESLSAYIPNRFRPKYEMVKLYLLSGDSTTARQMAGQILDMPVKIPSAEVDKIRAEMQQLLN